MSLLEITYNPSTANYVPLITSVVGVFGTLAAALIGLHYQSKNNRENLNNTRIESQKQREHDTKKEVLLAATESLSNALSLLTSMPTESSENVTSKFSAIKLTENIAKLTVSCSERTVESVTKFGNSYVIVYLEQLQLLNNIGTIDLEINSIQSYIKQNDVFQLEIDSQIAKAKSLNDLESLKMLSARKTDIYKESADHYKRIGLLIDEKLDMQIKNLASLLDKIKPVGDLLTYTYIEIRRELGFQTNEKSFMEIFDKSFVATRDSVRKLLESLQNQTSV